MIGTTVSHYKILEKLGEGGMGVVYKAEDTHLKRIVALKFIPPRISGSEEERARFLQEAQAAASLNHPNVCAIHSVGEFDGQRYIDMEFVDGSTLRQKTENGPLRTDEAIAHAIQIAEALHEAHSQNIVHRDVKAENIMVSSKNQIKVMDFGLAKLKGSLKLTKTSSTVGTLAYMAPEQIQGGEVDARSDLFSLGIVLYEMLTGAFPFRGEHEAAMIYSIVNEDPSPLPQSLVERHPELPRILTKALDKDPEDRYQSAKELAVDLRRLKKDTSRVTRAVPASSPQHSETIKSSEHDGPILSGWRMYSAVGAVLALAILSFIFNPFSPGSSGTKEPMRLVVLPFQNQGPSEQDYFVDGITEEVTSRLAGVSGLGVIARSSALQYKGTNKTLKEIGQELNVKYALLATVRWEQKAGAEDRLRVNPELVKIDDATQVWSEPFEAAFSGGFELQAKIASQVTSALGVSLLTPERKNLETPLTQNPEAYDFYLKGNDFIERGIFDRVMHGFAERMYKQALDLDPQFAAAWARLSILHSNMVFFEYDRSERRALDAKTAAEAALGLDPNLAICHVAMGAYFYHGRLDYAPALESYRKALTIQPNDPLALSGIGAVLRRQGKMQEALPYFEKVIELDPRSALNFNELGYTQGALRNYAAAEKSYERAIALGGDDPINYWYEAWMLIDWKADLSGAKKIVEAAIERKVMDREHWLDNALTTFAYWSLDYRKAFNMLKSAGPLFWDDQLTYLPTSLMTGRVLFDGNMGDPRPSFESARQFLEKKIQEDRNDSRLYGPLGMALAGLGEKERAIKTAQEGVRILPVTKEALRGAARSYELAMVYAMVGELNLAMDQLEQLPPFSNFPTYGQLTLDPVWKPLRELPRFKKLVASLAPSN